MNARCLLFFAMSLAVPARTALADPIIALHWKSCAGPINRNAGEGTTQSLFVSATGLRTAVGGIQLQVRFGSPGGGLADAWRFDPAGCPAVSWRTVLASTSKACPAITFGFPLVSSTFQYVTAGSNGIGVLNFAEAFASNAMPPASGPGFIVEFDLDQSAGTLGPGSTAQTCGCLDRPLCIALNGTSYLDAQGVELPFTHGQDYVTWNDPTNALTFCPIGPDLCNPPCIVDSTCVAATAARHASWGQVKGMYRAPAR